MGNGASCERQAEYPVVVHVYELGGEASFLLSSLGAGGIYHTGVEVNGVEYAFGNQSGVWKQKPTQLPGSFGTDGQYKRAEAVGSATLRGSQLRAVINDLKREFPPDRYDLLNCNCNHFTAAFCKRLGVNAPPAYINQLAQIGSDAASLAAGFGMLAAGLFGAMDAMDMQAMNMQMGGQAVGSQMGGMMMGASSTRSSGPYIERLDDDEN